jgi:hypothetical protein
LKRATELINPIEIARQPSQALPEPISRNGKIELLTKLFGYFRGAINNSKPSRKLHYTNQAFRNCFLEIGYNSAQFPSWSKKR